MAYCSFEYKLDDEVLCILKTVRISLCSQDKEQLLDANFTKKIFCGPETAITKKWEKAICTRESQYKVTNGCKTLTHVIFKPGKKHLFLDIHILSHH
jgi:hypothetical protein